MLEALHSAVLNIWYIVLVALFFGGSIFVHELGHFLAARWRGLKIDRFSIGMGPKIFSWTRNGVEYRLSWIPLGGYVALPQLADMRGIEGESGTEAEKLPPISYTDKMVVSAAGAVFNVIFAFLLATILWGVGQPVSVSSLSTTVGYVVPTIEEPQPDGSTKRVPSPASVAGLQVGDRILSIDGHAINDWNDISTSVVTGSGWADDGRREAVFTVQRGSERLQVVLHPRRTGDEKLRQVGIAAAAEAKVLHVPQDSPAAAVGLKPDDYLVSFGGVPIQNVQTYFDLLVERGTESLELIVRRDGQLVSLTVPPRPHPRVAGIVRDSISHQAGVRNGDLLLAINGKPIGNAHDFRDSIRTHGTATFTLLVQRGAEKLDFAIPARASVDDPVGIYASQGLGEAYTGDMTEINVPPLEQCIAVVKSSYRTLASLVNPRSDVGARLMSGPIEIVRVYHQVAKAGILYVVWLSIMVNISLAVFNVLPIPILDGGHMMFATITKLRGRPISAEFLARTQTLFFFLLVSMILYVSYFNAHRWVRDARQDHKDAQIIWEGQETAGDTVP